MDVSWVAFNQEKKNAEISTIAASEHWGSVDEKEIGALLSYWYPIYYTYIILKLPTYLKKVIAILE